MTIPADPAQGGSSRMTHRYPFIFALAFVAMIALLTMAVTGLPL